MAGDAVEARHDSCFARRRDAHRVPVELSSLAARRGNQRAETLVTLREGAEWVAGQPVPVLKTTSRACATLESIGDAVVTTDRNA